MDISRHSGLGLLYTWTIILTSFGYLWKGFPALDLDQGGTLAILILLGVLAEWLAVPFSQGFLSGGYVIILASQLICGGVTTAFVTGLISLIGLGIANRGNPLRSTLFNSAQHILAAAGAATFFQLASGTVLPIILFTLAYFLINHLLVYLYLLPGRRDYPDLFGWDALHWDGLTYLITAPYGALLAMIYLKLGIGWALVLFLPVLVAQVILRRYAHIAASNRQLTALFQVATEENKIKELTLRNIYRKESGEVGWGQDVKKINGKIFIDASVDGRLTRLAGNTVSVGRADWPAKYLPAPENGTLGRQQAATLMLQVKGVKTPPKNMRIKDWEFVRDAKGSWGLSGGKEAFTANPKVIAFNEQYGPQGFAIKPINAAANGKDSDIWWINCLLVFNVDGRAHQRDKGTSLYPPDMLPGHLNVDEAWVKAREFINTEAFIKTLREFKVQNPSTGEWCGFGEAELVRDKQNLPVIGQIMYIRESVHSTTSNELSTNAENNHYAVTTEKAQMAQPHASDMDAGNYQTRIGLGYYMMDINAFVPEDLKATGQYDWPVTKHLRSDWEAAGGQPKNPVYLPLETLLPSNTQNLLVPGYGASISSFAWAELRVLPNLAVLGDAAGVIAVRSLNVTKPPGSLSKEDIAWTQEKLKSFGARLDK